ncbi:FmdB family zinc ribbon protein [Aquihabitans daechungensis]|uniref:FmdB family zinc ribbon protein n=1 Tax=Aquihabitans daechungensis TaxID=1052257 RepID=UPI003BA0D6FC
MPTYEYRCKNCGHEFDVVQSFTDDSLTECPSCHEATLKKVFGNVGITFKGSGFYKTDSRSAGTFGSTRDADKSDNGSSPSPKKDAAAGSSGSSTSSDSSSSSSSSSSDSSTKSSTPAGSSSSSSASKPA